MAKWFGLIGFSSQMETSPGIWEELIATKEYYGDLIKNHKLTQQNGMNDDVTISNEISILADPFANQNFHAIRYVEFMGAKWKVTGVEVLYPRLILSIGGIYNG